MKFWTASARLKMTYKSLKLIRIGHISHVNIEGRGGLVGGRVRDENSFEAVGQDEAAVLAIVVRGLDDVVPDGAHFQA